MEELEHVRGIGLLIAVPQDLLLENVAGILLQQLTEIGLNHWIGCGAGDVHGDSIGSRCADRLADDAADRGSVRQRLTSHAGGGVKFGQHLKVKAALRGNSAGAGSRAEQRNRSVEIIDARALGR